MEILSLNLSPMPLPHHPPLILDPPPIFLTHRTRYKLHIPWMDLIFSNWKSTCSAHLCLEAHAIHVQVRHPRMHIVISTDNHISAFISPHSSTFGNHGHARTWLVRCYMNSHSPLRSKGQACTTFSRAVCTPLVPRRCLRGRGFRTVHTSVTAAS